MKNYIPQIIFLCLIAMGITYTAIKHGKPREGNHNIWTYLVAILVELLLLWWGGFFK
jgi:hypothetical protein